MALRRARGPSRLTAVLKRLIAAGGCAAMIAACPTSASGQALGGAPPVKLRAALRPEVLGRASTVYLTIQIAPAPGAAVPPPLTEAQLSYPAGLDVQLSGLGIDACTPATLELSGLGGCPPDSLMGNGSAVAELSIKHKALREAAKIAILRTVEQDGHFSILLYIYGETAVSANIILPGVLLATPAPYGGLLSFQVPLVPSLPESPDVSVGEITLIVGPKDLLYRERVHKKVLFYRPGGIGLPGRCPRGGFPFAVVLRFLGGEHASARTAVPCPRR